MESHCLLCDRSTAVLGIGAAVNVGHAERPDRAVLCVSCAALRPDEREVLRDQAMVRMLSSTGANDSLPPSC